MASLPGLLLGTGPSVLVSVNYTPSHGPCRQLRAHSKQQLVTGNNYISNYAFCKKLYRWMEIMLLIAAGCVRGPGRERGLDHDISL